MLDPEDRRLLLEALRPAPGATLDAGVGTSFSLNLEALLLTPLAFALFESDEAAKDPIALLAAIQQHASKLALYCDRSHIQTSPSEQKLLVLLESTVKPVAAPSGGAFHPKLWALRFRREDGSISHRLLVLSRNLTFDSSWDLLVSLDEGPDGVLPGRHVADFLGDLNGLSPSAITEDVARSVRRARFEVPKPFEEGRLHSFGLENGSPDVVREMTGERALVLSPFLTKKRLAELQGLGKAHRRTLVSRGPELERLGQAGVEGWGTPMTLNDQVDPGEDGSTTLRGLHAKLFVSDRRDRTTWFIGSANATTSAGKHNVETLLEFTGPRTKVGVGALLSASGKGVRFRDLLQPFELAGAAPRLPTPQEEDEERLEQLAAELCAGEFKVKVERRLDGYQLRVHRNGALVALESNDHLFARVVTRSTLTEARVGNGAMVTLEVARASEITALIAFQLKSGRGLAEPRDFVVQAELAGAPDDRVERLLVELIPDRRRFALLLFLLLAADDSESDIAARARHLLEGEGQGVDAENRLGIPLYEALVRASAHDPEKLVAIDKLVTRLCKTDEGASRLPDGFAETWECFQPVVKRATA